MIRRECDSVFAPFGHKAGPEGYYAEVRAEQAAAEAAEHAVAAAAEENRKAAQAIDPRIYNGELPTREEVRDLLIEAEVVCRVGSASTLRAETLTITMREQHTDAGEGISWGAFVLDGLRIAQMHEDNARQLQEMGARYDEATPYFNNHRPVAFDDDLSWATASIASNIGPLITIENGVPSFA